MKEESQKKSQGGQTRTTGKAQKRDRLASEAKLLKAAEDVFAKFGFKGATTKMIAKKAAINESLIGRYFDGKMGLFLAIIENHVRETGGMKELNYPPEENVADELVSFARFKFEEDGKKNFDFFKIVLSQAIVDPKFSKKIRELVPLFQQPELEERLEALKKAGKIRSEANLKETIKSLETFIFGNIVMQKLIAGTPSAEILLGLETFIRNHAKVLEP